MRKIVTVKRDIQRADRDRNAFKLMDISSDSLGNGHAAPGNPNKTKVFRALRIFDDLVGNALQRALQIISPSIIVVFLLPSSVFPHQKKPSASFPDAARHTKNEL